MNDYPKAVAAGWHPIATATQLRAKPLARQLMGVPVVVFRATSGVAVLVDRCPHRNFPLSKGRVRGGDIECGYHGWRFDGGGRCTLTPGCAQPARPGARALPVLERAGLIWTTLADSPAPFPALPHPVEASGYDSFWWAIRPTRATPIDAVENLLDPAHPHFLHTGVVRGRQRRAVEVTVRVRADRAEAVYIENARAAALMPRMLEGMRTTSIGRFFPPAIGQIAFEGPAGPRFAITVFHTPEERDRIRPFAHFATPAGRAPALFKELALRAFHVPVIAQDRAALRAQAENIARFNTPRYGMGPIDFLLPAIVALAEGEVPNDSERTLTIQL